MKTRFRYISFVLLFTIFSLFTGCEAEDTSSSQLTEAILYDFTVGEAYGTTCGNIIMGRGRFAYEDDFIYFSTPDGLYEYDLTTGITVSKKRKDFEIPCLKASPVVDGKEELVYNKGRR